MRCEDKRKGRGCDFIICTVVETPITGGLYFEKTKTKKTNQTNMPEIPKRLKRGNKIELRH